MLYHPDHWFARAAARIPFWMLCVIVVLTQLLISMIAPPNLLGGAIMMTTGAIQGWALGTADVFGDPLTREAYELINKHKDAK